MDRLALRPLLVGTAWKVLDLLLEKALAQAGFAHDRGAEYTIALKQRSARSGAAKPAQFTATGWLALMSAYAEIVEIRHSLVHRRAHTNATGALVGIDRTGQALRPLTGAEQESFARATLTAADVALTAAANPRDEARLLRHLAHLAGLHRQQLAAPPIPDVIPQITIVIDPDPADPTHYLVDLPAVRAWMPFQSVGDYADVIVAPRDRPGQELSGRASTTGSTADMNPVASPGHPWRRDASVLTTRFTTSSLYSGRELPTLVSHNEHPLLQDVHQTRSRPVWTKTRRPNPRRRQPQNGFNYRPVD